MQHNVVPGEARAGIDIRIPPHVDLVEMTKMLDEWTAGEGVRYEFFVHTAENKTTSTTDDNVWWCALKAVLADHGVPVDLQVFPAATDSYDGECVGALALISANTLLQPVPAAHQRPGFRLQPDAQYPHPPP